MSDFETAFSHWDNYDTETLGAANKSFYLWEERRIEDGLDLLVRAARGGHTESMANYAYFLLDKDASSTDGKIFMLKAAIKGCQEALDYFGQRRDAIESLVNDIKVVQWIAFGGPLPQHITYLCE